MEDLYENKDDLKKQDYIRRRCEILALERPYTSTVRQRGTFYNTKTTFGADREFPDVRPLIDLNEDTERITKEIATLIRTIQETKFASSRL